MTLEDLHKELVEAAASRGLSKVQAEVLRQIKAQYEREVREEEQRWGAESADHLAKTGISAAKWPRKTLFALKAKGFIELKGASSAGHVAVRGPYGKRVSHYKRREYVAYLVRPVG